MDPKDQEDRRQAEEEAKRDAERKQIEYREDERIARIAARFFAPVHAHMAETHDLQLRQVRALEAIASNGARALKDIPTPGRSPGRRNIP